MPTIKDLGIKVKAKYPVYRHLLDEEAGRLVKDKYPEAYSQFVEIEAVKMSDSVNEDFNRQIPFLTSSTMQTILAVILIFISIYLFYNVNTYSGWNIFAVLVISITFFILSLILFKNAHKTRHDDYEFVKQKINDRHEILAKEEGLRANIAEREVANARRQFEIAQHQNEIARMIMILRNDLIVSNAAQLQNLDPATYLEIQKMKAQAEIEANVKAINYYLDNARIRELKEIEHEAEKNEKQLTLDIFNIKNMLTFHEAQVLNNQLAGFSLQLEEVEKFEDSEYKLREMKRITNQMKAWGKSINGKYKQLQ